LRVGIAACSVAAVVLTDRFNLHHQQPGGLPGFSGSFRRNRTALRNARKWCGWQL